MRDHKLLFVAHLVTCEYPAFREAAWVPARDHHEMAACIAIWRPTHDDGFTAIGSRQHLVQTPVLAPVWHADKLGECLGNAHVEGYNAANLDRTPMLMSLSAPWLGMVFPTLIVVLSMTADHILDHALSRDINVEQFRARECKRVELLQVRLETERELLILESELALLRQRREQANGKVQREWFFWHWLRPIAPAPVSGVATQQPSGQPVQAQHNALATLLEEVQTTVRFARKRFGRYEVEYE